MAENCSKYLTKGGQVAIEGRIQVRTYDGQDGSKKYVTEVIAENVQFLDNKKDGQATDNNVATATAQNSNQVNPYEEMGRQVSMEDYPSVDENDLPF